VTPDYIQKSRNFYNSAGGDYQQYYFDEETGGFVLIHQSHNTTDSDRLIAETLAKQGMKVKLLTEQAASGVFTPDAEVNGEIYEFKELTEQSKSLMNRVQEGIGQARKQGATTVIYHINRSRYEIWQINRGIRQAFFWDKSQQIQKIGLLLPNEQIEIITREEWENGKYF
jgi:hypothetical protein